MSMQNSTRKLGILVSLLFSLLGCAESSGEEKNFLFIFAIPRANPPKTEAKSCPPPELPGDILLADVVVDAPGKDLNRPFGDPSRAILGICGGGEFAGSLFVYELNSTYPGGTLLMRWSQGRVSNEPGVDFIVFENAFRILGSDNQFFVEPVLVEVSSDGVNYCGFAPQFQGRIPGDPNLGQATQFREDWQNLAGLTPVLYNMGSNPIPANSLFDNPLPQPGGSTYFMSVAGGDGFDLDNLTETGFRSPNTGICNQSTVEDIRDNGFIYLKLTSAQSVGFPPAIGAFRESADIDGVVAKRIVAP